MSTTSPGVWLNNGSAPFDGESQTWISLELKIGVDCFASDSGGLSAKNLWIYISLTLISHQFNQIKQLQHEINAY